MYSLYIVWFLNYVTVLRYQKYNTMPLNLKTEHRPGHGCSSGRVKVEGEALYEKLPHRGPQPPSVSEVRAKVGSSYSLVF